MKFREFILNESHAYLGQRIGDILNALHDLGEELHRAGRRLAEETAVAWRPGAPDAFAVGKFRQLRI